MTERRGKLSQADKLTSKTTAARLERINKLGLKVFREENVIVYMPPSRVPYKVVELTGPDKQWVRIRPEKDADGHQSEVDPRFLSLDKPPKLTNRTRGRHG